ncbi:hypothetical protein SGRIM128S_07133 [Streptomyces griseomycini]
MGSSTPISFTEVISFSSGSVSCSRALHSSRTSSAASSTTTCVVSSSGAAGVLVGVETAVAIGLSFSMPHRRNGTGNAR